jgi:glycosyltransferase involved in cell wall biosynthesis
MQKLKPMVSIIIPCRNEVKFIDKCLRSVFSFDSIPGETEVIVVDGMSEDGTRDILSQWSVRYSNLKILDNPMHIVPTAMNIGLKAAKGDWIVRLDAHADYPKDYLRLCIETSKRTGADNVGGIFKTIPRDKSIQSKLVQALTTHRFGVGNANYRLNASEGPADTVPYGCYRCEVFDRIGLYNEQLVRNQDYEFNRRLIHKGRRIWLNPKIQIYYYNQGTILGLLRQAFLTAKWNTYMWYVAPYTFALRHLIPAIFVLTLIGSIILSLFTFIGLMLFISILSLYTVFAFIASMQQSRCYVWWMVLILPFLFLVYHIAYGSGAFWGLLKLIKGSAPVQVRRERFWY